MGTESIGQILLRETDLTAEQLDQALRIQQTKRPRAGLGSILIQQKLIKPQQFAQALERLEIVTRYESLRAQVER